MGYNFFNIGRLTYNEINSLVEVFNNREQEKFNAMKKKQLRSGRGR